MTPSTQRVARLLIFFALNPEVAMTVAEIVRKFGGDEQDWKNTTRVLRETNWLTTESREVLLEGEHVWRVHFLTGPRLLEEI